MELYDPHRRRVNDSPELIGRRCIVPRLTIFPREDATTEISAMIPNDSGGKFSSRQVRRIVDDTKLPEIIAQYRLDPESTLETLFSISLSPCAEPSDAELARDLARAERVESKPPTPPTLEQRVARIQL